MSIRFMEPSPVLVVNDETGEWVMTHNITRVLGSEEGSQVCVRTDGAGGSSFAYVSNIESPLTPEELRQRLFNLEEEV